MAKRQFYESHHVYKMKYSGHYHVLIFPGCERTAPDSVLMTAYYEGPFCATQQVTHLQIHFQKQERQLFKLHSSCRKSAPPVVSPVITTKKSSSLIPVDEVHTYVWSSENITEVCCQSSIISKNSTSCKTTEAKPLQLIDPPPIPTYQATSLPLGWKRLKFACTQSLTRNISFQQKRTSQGGKNQKFPIPIQSASSGTKAFYLPGPLPSRSPGSYGSVLTVLHVTVQELGTASVPRKRTFRAAGSL